MSISYKPVSRENQGTFNNPRQKTWAIWTLSVYREYVTWNIEYVDNSFVNVKNKVKELVSNGKPLDKLVVCELVPIDTMILPSV